MPPIVQENSESFRNARHDRIWLLAWHLYWITQGYGVDELETLHLSRVR